MTEMANDDDERHGSSRCSIDDDGEDLPRMLVVSQVPGAVFEHQSSQAEFEALFQDVDSSAEFHFLKKFCRVHVKFDSSDSAFQACQRLHEFSFMDSCLTCFLAQANDGDKSPSSQYLQPPQPQKQYLISPPGSPPDGWEPVKERAPAINYDLLSAIANLAPGEAHQVHASSSSQPSIVVQVCDDPQNFKKRPEIVPTASPQALT